MQLFCPCYTFACRLVICELCLHPCLDLTSSELHNNRSLILSFNFIQFHRYFDICHIKQGLFLNLLADFIFVSFAGITVAILHLVTDKRINPRYSFSISFSFINILTYADKTRHFSIILILAIPLLADLLFVSFGLHPCLRSYI